MSEERKKLGQKGERLAEKFLRRKGYRPIAKNLRRKAGELDLVMWDRDELVVIEVRTVSTLGNLPAWDRVPPAKRKQVMRVAEMMLTEIPDPLPPVRFDICVVVTKPKVEVHHLEDAFRPDGIGFWSA